MAEIKLKIASVVIGSGDGGGSGVAPYYADLPDKPSINGETLSGDMTSEDLGLASDSQAVPSGGTTGQVLAKKSNADNDVQWVNQESGEQGTTDYADLENKPKINNVTLSGNKTTSQLGLQAELVSGTNIKTINNQSIVGGGNITIEGGGTDDYADLDNKPQINSVTLSGNKSASDLGLATAEQGTKADNAIPMPTGGSDEQILAKDSSETAGVKWVTKPQDGKSAYQIWYEENGYSDPTTYNEEYFLASLKAQFGSFVPADYGTDGKPASGGTDITADSSTTNYIYLVDNLSSNPTAKVMWITVVNDSVIPNTYSWQNIGEVQVSLLFASEENLNDIYIDNTNLVNPKNASLAKAEDVLQLKAKLEGVTASETKVATIEDWHPEGSTSGYYNNGSWVDNSNFKSTRIDVSGYESIRFLGYNHHFNSFTPQYVFLDDTNAPIDGYHEYYDSTKPDGTDVEIKLSIPDSAKYFVCLYKAYYSSGGTTYLTESKFYAYLANGNTVVDLIEKQGKILSKEVFGELVYNYNVDLNIQYKTDFAFRPVTSNLSSNAVTGRYNGAYYINSAWYEDFVYGNKLYIKAGDTKPTYLMFLKSSLGTIISDGTNKTLQWLVEGDYLCSNHFNDASNTWTSAIVIPAGEEAYIDIPQDCYRICIGLNTTYADIEPCQMIKIGIATREGGIIENIKVDAGFYLNLEYGDIDSEGKVVPDNSKAVTSFITNGNGFYIELEEGYYVERAVLYDKMGNLVTYNYYVHSTSGHASTDNNCWGNNEQLSQYLVRLVLKNETDTEMPLNGVVRKFLYLNDGRLTKIFPQGLNYAKFMYKLHQLTNIVWKPVEKAQHNYGGSGINNTLWFLKDTVVTGVPYSTETEYSKFVGIDVDFRTFLSAAKNKRSVIYTECVEQQHSRSAYGLSYHGEQSYTGNFYGSVCTGLTSYLLGYNVNEYVGNMDDVLGSANKIAHGQETLYWGDTEVSIDELAQQLQPMDIILNSSHISVISDVYKDEYGVVQYIVWTEQTGPTARMIPYSKTMLAKRFANKEFSIYRLPSETWSAAFTKSVENTNEIIQNSFFDFEPKDIEIDPDISTFEGEYAVFVDNADNDNTDSYNNYKAFLNIHRDGTYTTLQIFAEDDDVEEATPIEENISTNSGTFIYNSSIYADDAIDKDDWIIVDLMQLSPKLSAGKYKARVVGTNIESGFTHFQIVSVSMTPTWNGNYVTRLDFEVSGGSAVSISQQSHIRPYKIKDISDSEREQKYVTFSGNGWDASSYYIKLVVRADYGTAVKRIIKAV